MGLMKLLGLTGGIGMGKSITAQFLRERGAQIVDTDELARQLVEPGQFFQPITNIYTMMSMTNSKPVSLTYQRVVATPDFLFSASDMAAGPAGYITVNSWGRNVNFNITTVLPGLAGPGIIDPPSTITFDKVGPVIENRSPSLMSQFANAGQFFIWGSFDGTTNDPVVYPNGSSIQNLASQILIQIYSTPSTLPAATNRFSYIGAQFSATGGETPYTWSLGSGTQLPQSLTLSTDGVVSGMVTNNSPGVYVFTIQLTDSANRVESLNYFITVY